MADLSDKDEEVRDAINEVVRYSLFVAAERMMPDPEDPRYSFGLFEKLLSAAILDAAYKIRSVKSDDQVPLLDAIREKLRVNLVSAGAATTSDNNTWDDGYHNGLLQAITIFDEMVKKA